MSNRFSHILILSDYDGTFAGADGRLVPRNLEAIRRFQAQGGHFAFSTGRLPSVMKQICPEFSHIVNAPLIMCNGALLYDAPNDTTIGEWTFDGVAARRMVRDVLTRFPSASLIVYSDDAVLLKDIAPEEVPGNRWRKVNFLPPEEKTALAIRDYIHQAYADRYRAFRSFTTCTEIVDKSISKGKRLEDLRAYYRAQGLELSLICCIGDYENDIDMLKSADVAFCPSNAIPEVKVICDHVLCDHDEGAIADMIKIIEEQYI